MNSLSTLLSAALDGLAQVDPSPLFALSLLPYLAFLWWARQITGFPPLALKGLKAIAFVQNDATGDVLTATQVDLDGK